MKTTNGSGGLDLGGICYKATSELGRLLKNINEDCKENYGLW